MRRVEDFEALYQRHADPWAYETSPYERGKYLATLRFLPRPFYGRGLELGCSIGVLSEMLARRCRTLVAVDASPTAVAQARSRPIPNATFHTGIMPRDLPRGRFDLILASEFVYYLTPGQVRRLAASLRRSSPGADCVVVAFTGRTNAPLRGRDACAIFLRALGATQVSWAQGRGRFLLMRTRIPSAIPRILSAAQQR